jgi:two-component system OmpR family response regulator
LAETVRRGLVAEGFVVEVEHDGTDGLAAAATGDFDVVVLDIKLPALCCDAARPNARRC